jgi:hypothetical protein
MPPQLTETWATAYLQILIGLFIFAIGIPAFAFQLVVQEDIRHVTHRRMKMRIWHTSVILLLLACVSFIWIIHPANLEGDSKVAPVIATPDAPEQDKTYEILQSYAGSIIVTIPILAIMFGFKLLDNLKRENVVRGLERHLEKIFDQSGFLEDSTLSDVVYLGEHGKSGREKKMALDALGRLAKHVQNSGKYKGCELEQLIRGLKVILDNGARPGEDDDFYIAANILRDIWNRLSEHRLSSNHDADMARKTIKHLAIVAVVEKSEPTALTYLEDAAMCDSGIVFEIGLSALGNRRFLIATAALNKLEAIAERIGLFSDYETSSNLLGLLSHFMATGLSTRLRAESFFAQAEASPDSLKTALATAFIYHYSNGSYDTSDRVAELQTTVESGGLRAGLAAS